MVPVPSLWFHMSPVHPSYGSKKAEVSEVNYYLE